MFNWIRNKMIPPPGTEVEVDNIYTNLPPPRTIIGEATEEEMEKATET